MVLLNLKNLKKNVKIKTDLLKLIIQAKISKLYFYIRFLKRYRNTLYWNTAFKAKNQGISACIKHAFWPFLDYGFNTASKTGNFGLNVAFNIEILINLIKYSQFFYILKILTRFLLNLLKSQY